MLLALHPDLVHLAGKKLVRNLVVGVFADDDPDPVFLGDTFQPGGKVYVVAHDGPGQTLVGPDVADIDRPGIQADSVGDCRASLGGPVTVQLRQAFDHLQSTTTGAISV